MQMDICPVSGIISHQGWDRSRPPMTDSSTGLKRIPSGGGGGGGNRVGACGFKLYALLSILL